MSHHFDYTADERLDISDAYCLPEPAMLVARARYSG